MRFLNWHNQNTNITTVETLTVLLQWLGSKIWEESSFFFCDSTGYDIVSVAWYIHIGHWKCSWLFIMIKDLWYPCMHISCHTPYMNQPFTFLPSIIPITSGGRYNLWSYTLCSFLQYPISFSHNSLSTNQLCSQIQSTVFPQCHSQSVTPIHSFIQYSAWRQVQSLLQNDASI